LVKECAGPARATRSPEVEHVLALPDATRPSLRCLTDGQDTRFLSVGRSCTVTVTEHRQAEGHKHTHGPSCGHEAIIHEDHVDYVHDGHLHHEHEGHYDECTACQCSNCTDACARCDCSDCTCPTCNHNACQCASCSDSCANCACSSCTCPTCKHAA
jgi:hypothetical protein